MLISRLRRKVLDVAERPLPLKAVRGIGFAFSPDA
jgi:DNA-binding response OmpR family regulator